MEYNVVTSENDPHLFFYRDMKIRQRPRGFVVIVGNNMELPGFHTNLFLATRAIDKEIGKRNEMKANRKRKKANGSAT